MMPQTEPTGREEDSRQTKAPVFPLPWQDIERAAQGLEFGELTLVFHEGHVVRVERLEKRKIG